jgi:hypothetical protein
MRAKSCLATSFLAIDSFTRAQLTGDTADFATKFFFQVRKLDVDPTVLQVAVVKYDVHKRIRKTTVADGKTSYK